MNEKKRKAYIAEMLICGMTTIATGISFLVNSTFWLKIAFGTELAAFVILSVCFICESRKSKREAAVKREVID